MPTYCCCLDVRGALTTMTKRELGRMFRNATTGKSLNADAARDHLLDQVAQGRKVIPLGPCDNFDYTRGCQGHPDPEPAP